MKTRMPVSYCTNCKKLLDGATAATKPTALPEEGCISICIYCGHVMVFGKGLILRNPTEAEMIEIAGNSDLVKIQTARKMLLDKHGNRSIFDDVDGEESP